MKVYVITACDPEIGDRVVAVYANKKRAEAALERARKERPGFEGDIEEFRVF